MPVAAGGADDRVGDGQAQARAAGRVRGPMEAVEDPAALRDRNAGARVVHGQAHVSTLPRDRKADDPALGRILAGVVQQNADETVEPLRRGSDDGIGFRGARPYLQGLAASLGHGAESVGRLGRQDLDVHRLRLGLPTSRIEAGQPEHVVDEAAGSSQLGVDAPEGRTVPDRIPFAGEGERRLGLDDRQGRPQLVRGIGGELDPALAGPLDREGDAPPDSHRPEEDEEQQGAADPEFGQEQGGLGLIHAVHRLADHQSYPPDLPARDTVVHAFDRDGGRCRDRPILRRKGQRIETLPDSRPIGVGLPQQDGQGAGVLPGRIEVRTDRHGAWRPAELLLPGGDVEGLQEAAVHVGGQVVRDDDGDEDGDEQVDDAHDRRRGQSHADGQHSDGRSAVTIVARPAEPSHDSSRR